MTDPQIPFWRRKAMSEMTRAEWESLCDGCGRCCLNKLIDEDTKEPCSRMSAASCSIARAAAAAITPIVRPR